MGTSFESPLLLPKSFPPYFSIKSFTRGICLSFNSFTFRSKSFTGLSSYDNFSSISTSSGHKHMGRVRMIFLKYGAMEDIMNPR